MVVCVRDWYWRRE